MIVSGIILITVINGNHGEEEWPRYFHQGSRVIRFVLARTRDVGMDGCKDNS